MSEEQVVQRLIVDDAQYLTAMKRMEAADKSRIAVLEDVITQYGGVNRAVEGVKIKYNEEIAAGMKLASTYEFMKNKRSGFLDAVKAGNSVLSVDSAAIEKNNAALKNEEKALDAVLKLRKQFLMPTNADTGLQQKFYNQLGTLQNTLGRGPFNSGQLNLMMTQALAGTPVFYKSAADRETFKNVQALVATYNQLSAVQNQVAQNTNQVNSALQQVGTTNTRVTRGMLISWESFGRLLVYQVLHSGIYAIISSMHSAMQSIQEFERRLSEIRTISQQNQLSVEAWGNSIRGLADRWGRDLNDVAEGVYQTISNQIAFGKDAISFVDAALKFSRVTVSSTEASVNLLSSAINSFKLSTADTEMIAAKFFKTIELGRVRAEEMANSFGKLGSYSQSLSVDLDDVLAAVSALTIKGMTYREAATLIENLMIRLVKPSKEMTEILNRWGVGTGSAAVATYGFSGVLRKLMQETHGSNEEMAKALINIRAIRGATGLANAFEFYEEAQAKIKNPYGSYEAAGKMSFETPGVRMQAEINRIRDVFVVDFGRKAVQVFDQLNTAVGGFAKTLGYVGRVLEVAIPTWIAYKTVMAAGRFAAIQFGAATDIQTRALIFNRNAITANMAAMRGLAASMITPGNIVLGTAAAVTLILESQAAEQRALESAAENAAAAFDAMNRKDVENYQKALDKKYQALRDHLSQTYSATLQNAVQVNLDINKMVENLKKQSETIDKALKTSVDAFTINTSRKIAEIEKQYSKLNNSFESAIRYADDLQTRSRELTFQIKFSDLKGDPLAQMRLLYQEYVNAAREGNRQMSLGEVEEGKKNYSIAERRLEQLAELQAKHREDSERLSKELAEAKEKQTDKEKLAQLRATEQELVGLQKLQQHHKRITTEQQMRIMELQRIRQEIRNSLNDMQGKDQDEKIKKLQEAYDKANAAASTGIDFGKAKLDLLKAEAAWTEWVTKELEKQKKLKEQMLEADKVRFDTTKRDLEVLLKTEAYDKQGKYQKDALQKYDAAMGVFGAGGITDMTLYTQFYQKRLLLVKQAEAEELKERVAAWQQAVENQKKKAQDQLTAGKEAEEKTRTNVDNELRTFKSGYAEMEQIRTGFWARFGGGSPYYGGKEKTAADAAASDVREKMAAYERNRNAQSAKELYESYRKYETALESYLEKARSYIRPWGKESPAQLADYVIRKGDQEGRGERTGATSAQEATGAAFALIKESEKRDKVLSDTAKIQAETLRVLGLMQIELDKLKARVVPEGKAFGGGFDAYYRGTDRIPAVLSPGEMVMSEAAVHRWKPQLRAMNMGSSPTLNSTYRSVEVGGVTINLVATGNTQVDVDAVAKGLRRAIRRGTATLEV